MVEEGDERWRSNTHGCDGGMMFALETTRPKWETNRRAQINMFGRGQAIGLETTRLEWETGDRAQDNTIGVGDERLGSKGPGGGVTQAVALELTR